MNKLFLILLSLSLSGCAYLPFRGISPEGAENFRRAMYPQQQQQRQMQNCQVQYLGMGQYQTYCY